MDAFNVADTDSILLCSSSGRGAVDLDGASACSSRDAVARSSCLPSSAFAAVAADEGSSSSSAGPSDAVSSAVVASPSLAVRGLGRGLALLPPRRAPIRPLPARPLVADPLVPVCAVRPRVVVPGSWPDLRLDCLRRWRARRALERAEQGAYAAALAYVAAHGVSSEVRASDLSRIEAEVTVFEDVREFWADWRAQRDAPAAVGEFADPPLNPSDSDDAGANELAGLAASHAVAACGVDVGVPPAPAARRRDRPRTGRDPRAQFVDLVPSGANAGPRPDLPHRFCFWCGLRGVPRTRDCPNFRIHSRWADGGLSRYAYPA